MKTFLKWYLKAMALFAYFGFLLPWGLSQPSNLVTTLAFVSIGLVLYWIGYEIYALVEGDKNDKNNRRGSY